MPTLLENPPQNPPPSVPLADLLRRRHRWERWRGFLFTLLAGLATTFLALGAFHFYGQTSENGKIAAGIWAGGLSLTILAGIVSWRFSPSSLLETARQMDHHLTAKNRLEATAALHDSNSLLAQAQREETTAYLNLQAHGIRPARALPWLVAAVVALLLAHLVTLTMWLLPMLHAHPMARAAPPPLPPVKELPKASIVWQSPEPESEANPIEEVPTVAIAQSTSGLKNLSLEISVNGAPKMSTPLAAQPFDQPGKNTLKTSLFMDEIGVEPFDIVSYFIKATRITNQTVSETTSPIQFIQVRPFRDDVMQKRGGEGLEKAYGLLIRLKLAELRSIKENFVLAHTDLAANDPLRLKENDRVGKNQGELSAKTEEVVQAFMEKGVSPDIIDLLRQAEPPMDDASKKILAAQNGPALTPQEKALSFIVEVEKFFRKVMADKGSVPPSDNPDDPFKDKQQHELKKRMALAAGQLETLARNQTKLSDDLRVADAHDDGSALSANAPDPATNPAPGPAANSTPENPPGTSGTNPDGSPQEIPLPPTQAEDPFGPDAGKGTFAVRQARILQGIETLLNGNKVLPPAVDDAMQQAQKDATASMQELDQANNTDAREPAATAAQDLQKAIAEMIKAGDRESKMELEASQQKLNDLAQQLRDLAQNHPLDASQRLTDVASQVHETKKHLEDAADKQQESGSAKGAQQLNQLARAIADQKVAPDLVAMAKTGLDADKAAADADKLNALASQAAQSALAGKPTAHDLAQLIDSLERSRANLARLAQQAGQPLPSPAGANGTPPEQKTPGQGQQPGQSPQPGQGQLPGQSPLPGQGQQPGEGRGQGQGQGQGQEQGQGSGGSGGGSGGNTDTNLHRGLDPADPAPAVGPIPDPNFKGSPAVREQGYREVLAQLSDEAQLTHVVIPKANADALLQAVTEAGVGGGGPHEPERNPANLRGGFEGIISPLDQLIIELKAALAVTQRDEVVKQPDLDEAPPAYRSAVSDYFEAMSKDYHPDNADPKPPKP
jgi:hypothetical protein